MQFDSLPYFALLLTVYFIYWRLGRVAQNLLVLMASYFFYAWWDWKFLGLIIGSSLVDYWAARQIGANEDPTKRRRFLFVSLTTNLGVLGAFKYFDFFTTSFFGMLNDWGLAQHSFVLGWVLPVGISFYTFQTLSYTIDVYHRKLEPTRSLLEFLVFVSFFPQLVAGPIERASRLLPQFEKKRVFNSAFARDGLRQILYGLFLKTVVSNNLGVDVDAAYNSDATGWGFWLATYEFAFQIYADFAGYSHIAIGSAKLLGFTLCANFHYPYLATSVSDFWSRWHISLSTWFRDYVYIPLGGNRVSRSRHAFNIFITFALSGLWHGASWTFLVWGLIHGTSVVLSGESKRWSTFDFATRRFPKLTTLVKRILTFHIVCLAWVFFRAPDVSRAQYIFKSMTWDIWVHGHWALHAPDSSFKEISATFLSLDGLTKLALMGSLIVLEYLRRDREYLLEMSDRSILAHWGICYLLLLLTLIFGYVGQSTFIYFQF